MVGVGAAAEAFDAVEHIAGGIAGGGEAAVEAEGDGAAGMQVAGDVDARTALQRIGPGQAFEGVVAGVAFEQVGAGIPHQGVGVLAAGEVLNVFVEIAQGMAGGGDHAGGEAGADTGGGMGVAGGVVAGAADEAVVAGQAFEDVIAGAAFEAVVGAVAHQGVGVGRALQVVDAAVGVALGFAGATDIAQAGGEAGVDAGQGLAVAGGVGAGAADQRIGAAAALQHIVAIAAAQGVGVGIAHQQVVVVAAFEVFNAVEAVARGIAGGAEAGIEADGDAAGGMRVAGGVAATAAQQGIGTGAAFEHIVASAAAQGVGLAVADQRVAEAAAAEVCDAVVRVTAGIAAGGDIAQAGGQRGGDGRIGVFVAGGVLPAAAHQRVGTGHAFQHIIACAAIEAVVVVVSDQRVVVAAALQVLDRHQHIARGVAGGGDQAGAERDAHGAAGMRVAGGVAASTADQHIAAGAAFEHVITRASVDEVGVGIAQQLVGMVAAGEVFNVGEGVAGGIAQRRHLVGREAGHHAGLGVGVAGRIRAVAALQRIGAGQAFEHVVAGIALQCVGAGIAEQGVVKAAAGQVFNAVEAVARGFADGYH